MPHKRNPIGSENLSGLARLVRANSVAAMENVALWHERDISHSSVERVIAPDSNILLDFMLHRLTLLLDRLVVYQDRMKDNLDRTGGLFFSQRVLLALTESGLDRDRAYRLTQRNAMATWNKGGNLKDRLLADPDVMEYLSKDDLENLFDLAYYLRHIDTIFSRVFEDTSGAR